jgi:pimeloyl-ACP methyl ester carboxylesterase
MPAPEMADPPGSLPDVWGGWRDVELVRVAANGIHFEVATMGQGDKLALCLHGFPEHAFSWRYQIPLLAKLGYRVWAPNLRGYGATDSPSAVEAYGLETLVEDVAGLIRASGARDTVLIGHDWGGMLAWEFAMRHSEMIRRMIIMNVPHPACWLRELSRPRQILRSGYVLFFQMPVLPELVLGIGRARMVGELITHSSKDRLRFPESVLAVYRRNAARPGGLTAMLNWYRAMRSHYFRRRLKREFPRVRTKTLVIWGDADRFFGPATVRGMEEHVDDVTLRILPGISHWVQQEAPDAVNALLESWLRDDPVLAHSKIVSPS